ncbi:MAG TPA: LysR substrate-binding domain-containing protein [Aquabacterium sp.]|uniref:LysR family transcriptional regulator n=1 Tax=Aquabacterium sp. TaxID=1872578 RepID=UPI002E30FADD|nr:LysR substrate-binding domain-containing protein [Aquabacterium sp.]HEX5372653.1 LysR substrate-binding domain-containing protein [Aquabacterium sp.]
MDGAYLQQSQGMADLLVFVKVIDLGSFTAAAAALGLGKPAVTKQMQRLERQVGVTLLHRTTRRIAVTEAGQVLYEHAASMVRLVEDASASLSTLSARPGGRLKMTASVTYGKHVLGPLLPAFHRQYPDIQVELLLVNRHVDLWEEGLDLAIRLTDEPPGQLAGRPLHRFDFVLCASPRFLRGKKLSHPTQLQDLPCLPFGVSLPGQPLTWRFDGPDRHTCAVKVSGPVIVNSSDVVRDLLLADMGLGLLPRFAVADDLATGRLRVVLPRWVPQGAFGSTAWALWQPQRVLPPKLRVMVDFLVEHLGPTGTSLEGH